MRLIHPKGIAGEEKACQYLKKHHWHIIKRNWHCRFGEIDIIASKNNLLVFFEVRYPSSNASGGAAESVAHSKLEKLKKSAKFYLTTHPTEQLVRLDALLLQGGLLQRVRHIPNISEN